MNELLIFLYIVENIYFVYRYYKRPNGIFSPVFIFAMMSLGVILPQLTTIYFTPQVYDPNTIPRLAYTMITCNLAFVVGWEREMSLPKGGISIIEFKPIFLKIFMGIFSLCSFVFTNILKMNSNVVDGVIAFQFQGLGILGLIMAIIYAHKYKLDKYTIACLLISTIPIIEYALSIYGSRQSLFTVALLYAYLITSRKSKLYGKVKKYFLWFFIVGMIGSMSIVEVRNSINSDSGYMSGIDKINYVDNLKKSFTSSLNFESGMDLGNAALCMDKCAREDLYNYGLFLWDGFVYNYIPRRLVGEDFKNSLRYSDKMADYIDMVTHGITCTTGYYDAFSSFSYLGFIVFFLLGRLFKFIYIRKKFSFFYEMMYLFVLVNSSVAVTHGLQLIFAKFEFLFILFLCVFFTLKKSRISASNPNYFIEK